MAGERFPPHRIAKREPRHIELLLTDMTESVVYSQNGAAGTAGVLTCGHHIAGTEKYLHLSFTLSISICQYPIISKISFKVKVNIVMESHKTNLCYHNLVRVNRRFLTLLVHSVCLPMFHITMILFHIFIFPKSWWLVRVRGFLEWVISISCSIHRHFSEMAMFYVLWINNKTIHPKYCQGVCIRSSLAGKSCVDLLIAEAIDIMLVAGLPRLQTTLNQTRCHSQRLKLSRQFVTCLKTLTRKIKMTTCKSWSIITNVTHLMNSWWFWIVQVVLSLVNRTTLPLCIAGCGDAGWLWLTGWGQWGARRGDA